jgi:hypothetical protein
MTRRGGRGITRLLASAAALALAGGGCSLIVSGDVPDFRCQGTDPSACPIGMMCDVTKALCVPKGAVAEGGGDAPDDAPSDPDAGDATREAEAGGPADLGAKCRVDADCKTRMCGTSTTLTTTITQTTGPICTTPCCGSADCPSSFVCFNGGTGGGYCVPANLAQRTPPASGGKGGGISCVKDGDCRSGLCTGAPKLCLDTCCTQSECGGTSICRVKTVSAPNPSHDVWVCAAAEPGATKVPGDACTDNTECATDNCIGVGAGKICRPPCSGNASCKTVAGFAAGHCLYGSSGSDFFKFCFKNTIGADPVGTACTDDGTCQSDYCDGELKKCANVCAKDSDCAANEACRPSATNTPYLRCVPKP